MAIKQFYHDIDLVNVGQLKNARIHNADDAAMTSLGTDLGADNEGFLLYNTTSSELKVWNGSSFIGVSSAIDGDVIFKGTVDASGTGTGNITVGTGAGEVEAVAGYQYVVSAAGDASIDGVDLGAGAGVGVTVESGDVILFTTATTASVIQRNIVAATADTAGIVELATGTEAAAGTDESRAVTPSALAYTLEQGKFVKQYFATVTTAADTSTGPDYYVTVTHNLNLEDQDAFVFNAMLLNTAVSVDVDSVDANSITITSLTELEDLKVTIMGASAVV